MRGATSTYSSLKLTLAADRRAAAAPIHTATMSLVHLLSICRQVEPSRLAFTIEAMVARKEAELTDIWMALEHQMPPDQLAAVQERVHAATTWSDLDRAELALAQHPSLDFSRLHPAMPFLLMRALMRFHRFDGIALMPFVEMLRSWYEDALAVEGMLRDAHDFVGVVRYSGEWNHYVDMPHADDIESALLSAPSLAASSNYRLYAYLSDPAYCHCDDCDYLALHQVEPGRLEAFLEEQALEDERAAAEYAGY